MAVTVLCYWSLYRGRPCTVILTAPVLWFWSELWLEHWSLHCGCPCTMLLVPVLWQSLYCDTGCSCTVVLVSTVAVPVLCYWSLYCGCLCTMLLVPVLWPSPHCDTGCIVVLVRTVDVPVLEHWSLYCGCPCTMLLVPVLCLSLYCGHPCTVILAAPVLWYWSELWLSLYSSTSSCSVTVSAPCYWSLYCDTGCPSTVALVRTVFVPAL